jgi:hypothetical protein
MSSIIDGRRPPVNVDVLANDHAPPGTTLKLTSVQSPTDQGATAVTASDGRTIHRRQISREPTASRTR